MILIYLFSIITTTGSIHDSKILNNQLDILNKKHKSIFNHNKIILAVAAYDSEILKNKVRDLNLGKTNKLRTKT